MFLQRNTAAQVFVVPGSLRAVADGAAVTSGTITVVKDGTSAASAGTLTHISGGAFKYAPTQGETDCKILGYVLEGTGAVTVCGSVRTTAADVNATSLGLVLAKTANITGLNDIAATAVVSGGAITTSGGSVSTVTNLTNLPAITTNWLTAAGLAADAVAEIQSGLGGGGLTAAQVWDLATAGHTTGGTFGAAVVAAGSAGDPWSTSLPGSYTSGTAGKILGDNLNATVGSRSTLDAAGVRSAVGLASANLDAQLTTLDDYLDTELAAVKAKTDLIPSSPAAVGSAMTLSSAGLDAITVESGVNARQALSVIASAVGGVLNGAATTEITTRAVGNPGTTRLTGVVDSEGNRSAVTLNLPS